MIVRNPYTRILSEYYWGVKWTGFEKTKNKDKFNIILKEHILNKRKNAYGHFIPQYKYIDNSINIHILKFENIEEEFNNLMKQYNLNIKLDNKDNITEKKLFSIKDFNNEVITLINKVYDKDFELFGYNKINLK
jgi:hypothetical protein